MATINTGVSVPVKIVAILPWAWEHQCGALNKGVYEPGKTCVSCRFETRAEEVQLFLLVSPVGQDA